MTSQKLPLFGGLIQFLPSGASSSVFVPPDATSKAPVTYELHLWAMAVAPAQNIAIALLEPASGKTALANNQLFAAPGAPKKVLDGYPVRGGVEVLASVSAVGAGAHFYGYYVVVGQGVLRQEERRAIGQNNLLGFNEGLGFNIPNLTSDKVHTFVKGRIDEVSLGAAQLAIPAAATQVTVAFEDSTNTPLAQPATFTSNPGQNYIFEQIPFGGGNPLLDHIRVTAADGDICLYGYFNRK